MTSDPRDYKLEIASLAPDETAQSQSVARPFLSVLFDCCGVYQRIYRDPSEPAYKGRCPRCGRAVHFPVGQGGTTARFFRVS